MAADGRRMRRRAFIAGGACAAAGAAAAGMPGVARMIAGGRDAKAAYLGGEEVWPGAFHPLDLDPLAWWAFDGDLADKAGDFDMPIVSATFLPDGINGMALKYNAGVTGYPVNSPFMSSAFADPSKREATVCWWSRQKGLVTGGGAMLERVIFGGSTLTGTIGTTLRFVRSSGTPAESPNNRATIWVTGTANAPDSIVQLDALELQNNVWDHFAVVAGEDVSGQRLGKFYVNGNLFGLQVLNDGFVPTINLCSFSNTDCDWCDMMVFTRALTAREVGRIFKWRAE